MIADDQHEVFPKRLVLARVDPEQNMARFYALSVVPDLFGGAQLIREWGRLGTLGQMQASHFDDEGLAMSALLVTAGLKKRRGYVVQ